MPNNRPAIPLAIQQELLFECRYRCACDCEPVALEKAHIVPWCETHDHSLANLIVLCANCHTRSHVEKWPESHLRRFKEQPCALMRDLMPVVSAEKKVLIDFYIAMDADSMSEKERLRFVRMSAACVDVDCRELAIISVTPSNSALIRLALPPKAAERLIMGFQAEDPRMASFFDQFAHAEYNIALNDPSFRADTPVFGSQGGIKLIETASPTPAEKPPVTNVKEEGLESLIVGAMSAFGWILGQNSDYEREYALDLRLLTDFLEATQPETATALEMRIDGPVRRKFLAQIASEITRRGTIDVMRKGIKHERHHVDMFYGTPSPENQKAVLRHAENRFGITRQLRYSREQTKRALDLVLFINGMPVATFELKNSLTKQTAQDAEEQYKRDRNPRETLFMFGRCVVHFAMDDHEVRMCTELKGHNGSAKDSWFLPFDQGWNQGAGNPPNPYGLMTDYLWRRVFTPGGMTEILENYAQIIEQKNARTGKRKRVQVFPRYHQLDVVRKLLADAAWHGAGQRYLIQHSAGSGKSNSIAWLAHQLVGLTKDGKNVFDSTIVITDRVLLDAQIAETIKGFAQMASMIGAVKGGDDKSKTEQLAKYLRDGKKIIVTTVQTFLFMHDKIDQAHRGAKYAIIIDEAHSSQGGRAAANMSMALSAEGKELHDEDTEDKILRIIESRKLLPNASYFAFTATPKAKTLQIFGTPYPVGDEIAHRPFHSYTMKQAIQEGFILDVLKNYTPVASYYRLAKTVQGDPEFDIKKARKKLRIYVESHSKAIADKAEIMVDHFREQVIGQHKIGGQARAMVVTSSRERAVQYFLAIRTYLHEIKSIYLPIVAFSGELEYKGDIVSEAKLNDFPGNEIADRIQQDPYRFLICAEKFQTGYDEPLLHTMYVDKELAGIQAVQTLSRLNRAHPQKHDVFVLDFYNDAERIENAFADYYRTTILCKETDPNKLHTLKYELDRYQVYAPDQIEQFVALYLDCAERDQLDPILDTCVAVYVGDLDEDGQVDFKGKAKAFCRTYGFLSSILPYGVEDWEKLSIFLNFLILKLPAPIEADYSIGILEAIDMDSYRAEKKATMAITLPDASAEIEPAPIAGGGGKAELELERLSVIIKAFNDQFGMFFTDPVRMGKRITEEIPNKVAENQAYKNARKNSDRQNARIEHDKALKDVITALFSDDAQLFKQFYQNNSFREWLSDLNFEMTYKKE